MFPLVNGASAGPAGNPGRPRGDRVAHVVRQAASTATALWGLPGLLGDRGPQLHPLGPARDPSPDLAGSAHAPVVLVHGLGASTACWDGLARRLSAASFEMVLVLAYNGVSSAPPEVARALTGSVRELLVRTGGDEVHLVGHSLGGLVVRLAAESYGLGDLAASVVTVATPHRGSALAWLAPGRSARWMLPGRAIPTGTVRGTGAGRPRYLNYYCARDAVLSRASARLELPQVENIELRDAGHVGAMHAEALLSGLPHRLAAAEVARRPVPWPAPGTVPSLAA
ncbi:MAG: alpha/beta fold hydrolase [Nocardioidaceae bacterium]